MIDFGFNPKPRDADDADGLCRWIVIGAFVAIVILAALAAHATWG